uniref:Uncharacterized protein n=1 Tax=Neobacillus citreus TaxID=2833578 RepID=A0A942T2Z0_9BACI
MIFIGIDLTIKAKGSAECPLHSQVIGRSREGYGNTLTEDTQKEYVLARAQLPMMKT